MKYYQPADARDFACLKGACAHTCCAGWEIDIDPETLAVYRQVPPPFGDRLRAAVREDGGTASFRLDGEGRCLMLNGDGLCSLILNLGEDALCQICRDHPRYRNYFSDRVETGFGLCCEAAARQTVARKEPFRLVLTGDDGQEERLTEDERILLSWREKLLKIVQDPELSPNRREEALSAALPGFSWPAIREDTAFLLTLERLDGAWDKALARAEGGEMPAADAERQASLGQLAAYFLYRHLPDALEDGLLLARSAFAFWAVRLIARLSPSGTREELADTARMFSGEIEYSQENLNACLAYLDRRFLPGACQRP